LPALIDYARDGDTVVVWKLDRLGRDSLHILETVKELTDRGVTLISTTDGIDSSTASGRMMFGVLGSLAGDFTGNGLSWDWRDGDDAAAEPHRPSVNTEWIGACAPRLSSPGHQYS
jgi:hypothetical protein